MRLGTSGAGLLIAILLLWMPVAEMTLGGDRLSPVWLPKHGTAPLARAGSQRRGVCVTAQTTTTPLLLIPGAARLALSGVRGGGGDVDEDHGDAVEGDGGKTAEDDAGGLDHVADPKGDQGDCGEERTWVAEESDIGAPSSEGEERDSSEQEQSQGHGADPEHGVDVAADAAAADAAAAVDDQGPEKQHGQDHASSPANEEQDEAGPQLHPWEESPGVNITDTKRLSILLVQAADKGRVNDAKTLITCGADPNYACIGNETEIHPRGPERTGWTPLMYAAAGGRTATCSELLKMGADPNRGDKYMATALHAAADRGKTATVAALVDMGCKVTALTYPANFTALHYAAMRGFKGTVLCLLRKGADVRALSKFGDDAAEMARDCEQEGVYRMLEDIKIHGLRELHPPPRAMPFAEFQAGAFVHKRHRTQGDDEGREERGDKRPRFFDGCPSRPSLLMPAPLRPPSILGEIEKAGTDEGAQEERGQTSNGVQARYGRNDVQQQQHQQQGNSRVETMQFGGWGVRAGGGGDYYGGGGGGGGVRAMVDEQRRRKRLERQEEIKQGMKVPGKVVFRNVPYNMDEAMLRARILEESLPDPLQVQVIRNPTSQIYCLCFVQFPDEQGSDRAIEVFDKRHISDGTQSRMLHVSQFYQVERNPHGESRARDAAREKGGSALQQGSAWGGGVAMHEQQQQQKPYHHHPYQQQQQQQHQLFQQQQQQPPYQQQHHQPFQQHLPFHPQQQGHHHE